MYLRKRRYGSMSSSCVLAEREGPAGFVIVLVRLRLRLRLRLLVYEVWCGVVLLCVCVCVLLWCENPDRDVTGRVKGSRGGGSKVPVEARVCSQDRDISRQGFARVQGRVEDARALVPAGSRMKAGVTMRGIPAPGGSVLNAEGTLESSSGWDAQCSMLQC